MAFIDVFQSCHKTYRAREKREMPLQTKNSA